MASVKLRFYGRFLFTKPHNSLELNVLAIYPKLGGERDVHPHRFFMTARGSHSVRPNTRPPDFKVMVALPLKQAEHAVWDLEYHDIKVEGAEGPNVRGDLTQLPDLSRYCPAPLDQSHLSSARRNSPVAAIIKLATGDAMPVFFGPGIAFQFARMRSPTVPDPSIEAKSLAETMEVNLNIAGPLRFEVASRADGSVSAIEIPTNSTETVEVSLSNVCAGAHAGPNDREFAAYYDVLSAPPSVPDRLIPLKPMPWSEVPCVMSAYIEY